MKKLFTLFLSLIIFCSTNVYANEEMIENTSPSSDVSEIGDANNNNNDLLETVIPTETKEEIEEKGEVVGSEESDKIISDDELVTGNNDNSEQISPSNADSNQSSNAGEEKVSDENKNELLDNASTRCNKWFHCS